MSFGKHGRNKKDGYFYVKSHVRGESLNHEIV